jgi:hypothetical protein
MIFSPSSSSSSSSIKYPPGPHSVLPNKLLRKFVHNPIKTLMDIAYTYDDIDSKGVPQTDLLYTLLQAQDAEAGIGQMTDVGIDVGKKKCRAALNVLIIFHVGGKKKL